MKKIKQLFELKPYCKRCKWHIPVWIEDKVKKDFDICGATLEVYTNEIGKKLLRTYGDTQKCDICGSVLQDNREIRKQKCINKNMELKCKDFKFKWYYRFIFRVAISKTSKDKK